MIWAIFAVLSILWLIGLSSGFMIGNFVYVLLLAPIVTVIVQFVLGKRSTGTVRGKVS